MAFSELRLIKNSMERVSKDDIKDVPLRTRGIYVLFKHRRKKDENGIFKDIYDVVYVGMARGLKSGIAGRLLIHQRHPDKGEQWSHFSAFEVWDNIREDEIAELEGLFRHIYRFDSRANKLNIQKSYSPLIRIRRQSKKNWKR